MRIKKEDKMRMRINRRQRREEEGRGGNQEKRKKVEVTGWGGVNRVWLVHP